MSDQHPVPTPPPLRPTRLFAETDGHGVYAYLPRTLLLPDAWDGEHRVMHLDGEQARELADTLTDAAEDLASAQLFAEQGDTDPEPDPDRPARALEAPPAGHRMTVVRHDESGRVRHEVVRW